MVGPGRPGPQESPFVLIEADPGLLPGGPVDPDVRRPLEPALRLLVQVGVPQELATVEEVAADVTDRAAPPSPWSWPGRAGRPGPSTPSGPRSGGTQGSGSGLRLRGAGPW